MSNLGLFPSPFFLHPTERTLLNKQLVQTCTPSLQTLSQQVKANMPAGYLEEYAKHAVLCCTISWLHHPNHSYSHSAKHYILILCNILTLRIKHRRARPLTESRKLTPGWFKKPGPLSNPACADTEDQVRWEGVCVASLYTGDWIMNKQTRLPPYHTPHVQTNTTGSLLLSPAASTTNPPSTW